MHWWRWPREEQQLRKVRRELEREKHKNAQLAAQLKRQTQLQGQLQLQAEQEEEYITNKLMKRLEALKHEKEELARQVRRDLVDDPLHPKRREQLAEDAHGRAAERQVADARLAEAAMLDFYRHVTTLPDRAMDLS